MASSVQRQRGAADAQTLRERRVARGEQRHVLCGLDDIPPGTVEGFRAGGRKVALTRLDDGSFRVVADTCPHQAAQLSLGSMERMWVSDTPGAHHRSENRNVLLCPWHGFEFDLETGGDPCVPGRPDLKLKTYHVEIEGDEVVVYL
ncbi:MAG TPA: Rieske (2Fe-2S) protein [Rubrobacter sp.]|nr:Rieske (2Fe-2S) protein [Rubrobacter sp.]HEX5699914.1 Rieske (2Fe-2S) protein [Rubrobacter sp.]